MARRLLIIYNKSSGQVLASIKGTLITHRKQLLKYVKGEPLASLAFYYEEEDAEIDFITDRILKLREGQPPALYDAKGNPTAYLWAMKNRATLIQKASRLKIDFEGGVGDQIMQLEAVKELKLRRPDLIISIGFHSQYQNLMPFLEHHGDYSHPGRPQTSNPRYIYINNNLGMLYDPRGNQFGKAAIYGAQIGLESVHQHTALNMPADQITRWIQRSRVDPGEKRKPFLGIHVRSLYGDLRSWREDEALKLADLWSKETGGTSLMIGKPQYFPALPACAFTLPFPCDFASTAAWLTLMQLIVCIDSGPMHLARAANIPHIIIWQIGGPGYVLGRPPNDLDIYENGPLCDPFPSLWQDTTKLFINRVTAEHVLHLIKNQFPKFSKEVL